MEGKIFINYRREDDRGSTGRLFDVLEEVFDSKQLFIDIDNIEPGDHFSEVIEVQIRECDVLLVVIGEEWLEIRNVRGQRRLDDENDFVRIEIETALRLRKRVIPVLLDGAEMPAPDDLPESIAELSGRNAARLRHETFRRDARSLANVLKHQLAALHSKTHATTPGERQPPDHRHAAKATEDEDRIASRSAAPDLSDGGAVATDGRASGAALWQAREFRMGVLLLAAATAFFLASIFDAEPVFGHPNVAPRILCLLLFLIGLGIFSEAGRGQAVLAPMNWRALIGLTAIGTLVATGLAWIMLPFALVLSVVAACLAAPLPSAQGTYAAALTGSAALTILYGSSIIPGFFGP